MTAVVACGLLLAAACAAVPGSSRGRLAGLRGDRPDLHGLLRALSRRTLARAEASRRVKVSAMALGSGSLILVGYGPVAGLVAAAYGGLATQAVLRRRADRAAERDLVRALDGVASLVADMRAGVPPAVALGAALPLLTGARPGAGSASLGDVAPYRDGTPRGRLLRRLCAAWQLADSTGAPLGDVLERLDMEVRAGRRTSAVAFAHAASARATAMLLAGLPMAGVALGYGMGAEPLHVLFGTPLGAACALTAVALQVAGLAWARRISEIDPERVDPSVAGP